MNVAEDVRRTMVIPRVPDGGCTAPSPITQIGAHMISMSGAPGPEVRSRTGRPSEDLDVNGSLEVVKSSSAYCSGFRAASARK